MWSVSRIQDDFEMKGFKGVTNKKMHEYDLSPPASNNEAVNSPNAHHNLFASPASSEEAVNSPKALINISHRDPDQELTYNSRMSLYLQNSPDSLNVTSSNDIEKLYDSKDGLNPSSIKSPIKTPDSTIYMRSCSDSSTNSTRIETDSEGRPASNKLTNNKRTLKRSLSTPKDACQVCSDKPDGFHYDVLVCKSCQGFFKRSIKNNRSYMCIDKRDCVLMKKNRNHCKACRLSTCFKVGMNKEAVEQELLKEKSEKSIKNKKLQKGSDNVTEVSSSLTDPNPLVVDMKLISEAELFVDPKIDTFANINVDPIRQIGLAADKQLTSLAEWAKRLPHFSELKLVDQVKLLQWNWPDLLVGGFSYRSSAVSGGILLATGVHVSRENIKKAGFRTIINKLFAEVIMKIQKYQIDIREWGCLRAIMLFAPDTKDIVEVEQIENIRDRYIATLCEYTKQTYPDQPHRIGNLLLRLPPLRAISLQILEHLFFFKVIGDVPIDTFLFEMLDVDNH